MAKFWAHLKYDEEGPSLICACLIVHLDMTLCVCVSGDGTSPYPPAETHMTDLRLAEAMQALSVDPTPAPVVPKPTPAAPSPPVLTPEDIHRLHQILQTYTAGNEGDKGWTSKGRLTGKGWAGKGGKGWTGKGNARDYGKGGKGRGKAGMEWRRDNGWGDYEEDDGVCYNCGGRGHRQRHCPSSHSARNAHTPAPRHHPYTRPGVNITFKGFLAPNLVFLNCGSSNVSVCWTKLFA